jgi:hypothetical protein
MQKCIIKINGCKFTEEFGNKFSGTKNIHISMDIFCVGERGVLSLTDSVHLFYFLLRVLVKNYHRFSSPHESRTHSFLLVPRKNLLSRILCCGRERTFSLQEQYPNWIFYFALLIKYLNRASSPSYGF